jgi:CheY-like chemotaxis protein
VIFQEFAQVANPLQSRVKGTGLGLPLARKLAELLGGHISVDSTPGVGSVFILELPRSYRSASLPAPSPKVWGVDPTRSPVLLVEDDPADALALQRWLADSPYQVLVASSIAEAQRALQQVTPVAIILDVILLGAESWRLMLELRSGEAHGDTPMIVTSSAADEQKALHLGADEYLRKPLDRQQVISLLDRLTGRRGATDVLVVDDEEVARYLVRQLLPKSRFRVHEASDGQEGLHALRTLRPALVLLDINMPGRNGFEFLEEMQRDAELSGIPAIVLTSAVLTSHQRFLLRAARDVLSKGELSADMLIGAIVAALPESATPLPFAAPAAPMRRRAM